MRHAAGSLPLVKHVLTTLAFCFFLAGSTQPKQQNSYDHSLVDGQISRARALRAKGNFIQAAALLDQVIIRARRSGYKSGEVHALLAKGACQISLFEYRSALNLLTQAETLGISLGDMTIQGAAALNKATAYAELGDFALGLQQAHRSALLFEQSSHQDYLAKSLLVYANLQASSGKIDDALSNYSQVIAICQRAHLPEIEASAWEDEGESLLDANRLAPSEAALRKAYSLRLREKSLSSLAVTVSNLAELKLKQGQLKESLSYLNQVSTLPSAVLSEIPAYELLETRGELFTALGREQAALSELYAAVSAADRVRASSLPATRLNTIVHLHTVYQHYINLAAHVALQHHNNSLTRRCLGILARSRAAAYRDEIETNLNREGQLPSQYLQLLAQLQQAQAKRTLGYGTAGSDISVDKLRIRLIEMENQLSIRSRSGSVSFNEKVPDRIVTDIQAHLGANELLLSVALGPVDSYLWATTSREVHLYRLPARQAIEAHAKAFAESVRRNSDSLVAARAVSNDLFGSLPHRLLSQSNWLLDADGELLDGVPFSALPVPSTNQKSEEYLITRHSLRLLPSGDLMSIVRDRLKNLDFLGVGDAIYNTADSRWKHNGEHYAPLRSNFGLARLVGSKRELDLAVKNLRPSTSTILAGQRASTQDVTIALLKRPNVIHFAVHVISQPDRPQEAALALSLSAAAIPDLITPETVESYRVPGSLVVLSGCASQQGEVLPVVGVIGLSRSWLIAGASAVVVSAWPTADTSGDFFGRFYRYFRDNAASANSVSKRAAQALQLAQRDFAAESITNGNSAGWSAYSVISTD